MKFIFSRLFTEFFESEKAGGFILILVSLLSLLLANIPGTEFYPAFWNSAQGEHIVHFINDGLMTVFFLLVGLELEREVYTGQLSNLKNASLPLFGALGGMLAPAALFYFFNAGLVTQAGTAIPTATDIAFAISIVSLLGNRVPVSLKVFIAALAVIDDLGAILIIALFYSKSISWLYLAIALGVWVLLLILNRCKVHSLAPYLAGGVTMWFAMCFSGVHPTITGVLLAFTIPFGSGHKESASWRLQHILHKPVALFVLPLFAMANTCLTFDNTPLQIFQPLCIGIVVGLVIGKPLGIWLFCRIAVLFQWSHLPAGVQWKHLTGAGLLCGIGFTMSVFITLLAFADAGLVYTAKCSIILASTTAGLLGYVWLRIVSGKASL